MMVAGWGPQTLKYCFGSALAVAGVTAFDAELPVSRADDWRELPRSFIEVGRG
jgi:hypothetical protein